MRASLIGLAAAIITGCILWVVMSLLLGLPIL